MRIKCLDHITIRTTQIVEMVRWYADVLGLEKGKRPLFRNSGAWMYVGDRAVVHIEAIDGTPAIGSEHSLKLEHFAFSAQGAYQFESRLKLLGVEYTRSKPDVTCTIMFNIWDPDGNHIHVDFSAHELLTEPELKLGSNQLINA